MFDCSLKQTEMHGESPYLLMFGPDICGHGTKKVRFASIITFCSKLKCDFLNFCLGSRNLQLQGQEPFNKQGNSMQG